MGWEQRGNNSYYYKKEREGSRVKSVYVGRGEIAHMVAQLQSSSPLLERFARSMKSPEVVKSEKAEAALEQASDLIELITEASLLAAGFHAHHRQWFGTNVPHQIQYSNLNTTRILFATPNATWAKA